MTTIDETTLTQLGRAATVPAKPEDAVLETVPNPHPGCVYLVRFTCPEFTTLCPVTGQPDFAHLVIDYVPADRLVESKSLKLYLNSFNASRFADADAVRARIEADLSQAAGAPVTICLLYTSPSPRD